jgi:spoIIIJ-associated protein
MSTNTAAQQWLEKVLDLAGFSVGVENQSVSGQQWLTIDSKALTPGQVTTLIGTDGAALDALQYLANEAFAGNAQSANAQSAIVIELDGYRQKRSSELKIIADRAAEHVRSTGTAYEMPPLSGGVRRELHSFFEASGDYPDLATTSRGVDADRRLVVELKSP